MGTFESLPPEEILQLLTNIYKAVVRTGTSSTVGKIAFLRKFLQVEALREYDLIVAKF